MPDENNKKIHLPIKGMVCEGCVESVKKALESVEGVERAEVSLENNEAVVTYEPIHATENTLRKAVQSAGYEVVD